MVERVVLEDHREPIRASEKSGGKDGILGGTLAYPDGKGRFTANTPLEIARPIGAIDAVEPAQQVGTQALGNRLAADNPGHPVRRPRKSLRRPLIDEVLQEGRIAGNDVMIARAHEAQRLQYLPDI